MIAKMVDHPEMDFFPSLRLLIRISHDLLLAGAGWMILTVGSQLPALLHPQIAPFKLDEILQDPVMGIQSAVANVLANPAWLILISASVLVVLLAIVFWYMDVIVRPPRTRPQTWKERMYTLLSFPMMPVITLIVLAIPTIQAQTRLLFGIPLQFRVSKKI
jgi:heme/copper-type cytochrome/quinol oxidase subunit 2